MTAVRAAGAVRAALVATVTAVVAGLLGPGPAAAAPTASPTASVAASPNGAVRSPCAAASLPATDDVQCLAVERATPGTARPDVGGADADPKAPVPDGISPSQLRTIYGVSGLSAPAGTTVGIVVAYDAPTVEANLATFRSTFGLPACTTANGCFRKVDQRGRTVPANKSQTSTVAPVYHDDGWQLEITLDTQAVSAMCPSCRITLVEADSASLTAGLGPALARAAALGSTVIGNSFAGGESADMVTAEADYWSQVTVPVFAASGDHAWNNLDLATDAQGYNFANFPATSPSVIAVGGTSATVTGGTVTAEKAWADGGSGCSVSFARPAFQTSYFTAQGIRPDTQCGSASSPKRAESDVSAMADPYAPGFPVYRNNAWTVAGGTSLAVQLVTALAAYAGPRGVATSAATVAYGLAGAEAPTGLVDITAGTNKPAAFDCGGERICTAAPGWDGPTGLGTPRGLSVFAPLLQFGVTSVLPGGAVPVSGSNFVPGETVVFRSGGTVLGSEVVDYNGDYSGSVVARQSARTSTQINVSGSVSGFTASGTLAVPAARVGVPAAALAPGQSFGVTAVNMAPRESVTFAVTGGSAVVTTADGTGSAAATLTVPVRAAASLTVTAAGADSGLAPGAAVAVPAARATLPASIALGASATLAGTGFAVGEDVGVAVSTGSRQLTVPGTVTATGTGSLTTSVSVPRTACPTSSTVTLTGADSGRTASVTFATPAADTLPSGCQVGAGTTFTSAGGQYRLVLQSDGNLVLYAGSRALWGTGTSGASPRLILQPDGNLVLYSGSRALWSSRTSGTGAGGRLVLQPDGNLVLLDASGRTRWSRGVAGTDTLTRGGVLRVGWYTHTADGSYRLVMQADGNLVLYTGAGRAVWSTRTAGANGYATLQTDGNFVVYAGGRAVFNARTNGSGYTLKVQTDGNLVVYSSSGAAVWHR